MTRDVTVNQPEPGPDEYQDHLMVPCPRCSAAVRQPCDRPTGSHIPHAERVERWVQRGKPSAASPQASLYDAQPSFHEPGEWE